MINPLVMNGRVRRSHFLAAMIALNLVGVGLQAIVPESLGLAMFAFGLFLWPATMLMIQRAHDFGSTAAFGLSTVAILITLLFLRAYVESNDLEGGAVVWIGVALNLVGAVLLLSLILRRGKTGSNDYGPDPRSREDFEAADA